jgi:hypothetical protein
LARSKTIEASRKKELEEYRKMTPSERLSLAVELSELSLELMRAGRKTKKYASIKKS